MERDSKRRNKDVIIVTGSCGRIGANVVRRFSQDFDIVGFELLKALYAAANEELVPVDISSDESVHQALNHIRYFYGTRIAAVVHLAAFYSFSDRWSPKYDAITVKGTERLLKGLQSFEVEQFLFSSTMLVHAPTEPGEKIREESPFRGNWGYPDSKIKTEELIHELRGKMPAVNLRIAGVYDDRCHSIPISNQIVRIYEKQLTSRFFPGDVTHGNAFLHMDDLVEAIWLCVQKRKSLPEESVFLLGESEVLSYDYLQRRISRLIFGKEFNTIRIPKWCATIGAWMQEHTPFMEKPFIRPWMISLADDHYELDISKAAAILGWRPKHRLDDTLPMMIELLKADPAKWYKENGLRYSGQ